MISTLSGKSLSDYIKPERLISLTRELIAIPSFTGEEGKVASFIADRIERLGLELEVGGPDGTRPNVIGTFRGSLGRPVLIYNGHMDTVPLGEQSQWSHDPFGGEISEGRLYGRGSQDMKGGLAAMLEVVEAFKDAGVEPKGDLILEFVVDEERGGYSGTKWCVEKGIRGDYAVVCEGGDNKIHVCHKGDYGFELTVFGKSAHAATPEKGVNAIHNAIKIANALLQIPDKFAWRKRSHRLVGEPLLGISVIQGGVQRNMVPEKCLMIVDRRVDPGFEDLEIARREVQEVLGELKAQDETLRFKVDEIIAVEPSEVSEDEEIVQALQSAALKVLERELEIGGLKGFTDAHWLIKGLGIPAVSFGTHGGNIHGIDEYVEVASLIQTAKILTLPESSFCDFCKSPSV